ncbi:MAG TPA: efflux transporter outer membrane subunit [Steroidobacteraceae bacterium]
MNARQPAVRPWRTWLLLALGLGADACSVEPSYRHPAVSTPVTWQQAPSNLSPAWPAAEWWHEFGSNPLDQLITQAQAGNDDIAAAIARVREADAQARIAGAALLPGLGLQGGASRQRQRPIASGAPITYDQYSALLTASYELDFWGKNRATHEAALQAAQASRYDRQTVALTVITSVALTYFETLEQHDRLEVARDDLDNAQKILSGIELEQTVGTATALDVAQQATTVATLNASIPPLAQQLQQSLDSLAILVGQTPESLEVEQASLDQISAPPVIAGLPSELLARRPDVAAAEAQLKAANADIGVARAAYFPSIDLTASGGFASVALSTLLTPQSRVFALSAALSDTIFDAGARGGQVQYSRARYAELLSDYHKAVLSALGNVEDALTAVQQTAEQELRQRDAVDKARRAFEYSQIQMQAGTTNILTVLNTESALFTAHDTLVQVKYQHLQALVDLYQALGGGWQQSQANP